MTGIELIRARDPFGLLCTRALRRVHRVGYEAWLAEEYHAPSSPDPDWTQLILALRTGVTPRYSDSENDPRFRCLACRDTDFAVNTRAGRTYGERCPACADRRNAEIGTGNTPHPVFEATTGEMEEPSFDQDAAPGGETAPQRHDPWPYRDLGW